MLRNQIFSYHSTSKNLELSTLLVEQDCRSLIDFNSYTWGIEVNLNGSVGACGCLRLPEAALGSLRVPAHLLRPPQDVKPNFSSLIAPKVQATQGTTVVSLESVWDHPKNFYSQKTNFLWAKYATFT